MLINKYNGLEYEPFIGKKKKILLLSDDIRFKSGVSTMAREIVLGTCHKYDWVNLGGSIKHPEKGNIIDLSQSIVESTGVTNANVKVIPVDGYGDPNILMQVINAERPDTVCHFTDPRYWIWLYQMEKTIRCDYGIPISYINVWDSNMVPRWNFPYYQSCDLLLSISHQTYNVNKWTLGPELTFATDGEFDIDGNKIPFSK